MIKLLLTNSKGTFDTSQLVSSMTWAGDYQQCARTLEFGLISSYIDKNIPVVACELGSNIVLMNSKETLFDGFIFERQKGTGSSLINTTCYDRGIYLKRNEATYKFSGLTPEAITKRICTDFSIPIGSLAPTGVKITRNFIGVSLYNIMQTVYTLASEQNGKKYMLVFKGKNLCVIEKAVTDETLIIEGGSNLMSATTTESISSMINQVAIYNSNDELIRVQKDDEVIKLYGLMQSVLRQADKDDVSAKAKKILLDNGVNQKITLNNLGNVANIAGGTVVVREPYTGLYGLFYIDSDTHTWKRGQYYNKLVVNFKNIMDEQEAGALPNKSGKLTEDASEKTSTWEYLYKPGGMENE